MKKIWRLRYRNKQADSNKTKTYRKTMTQSTGDKGKD